MQSFNCLNMYKTLQEALSFYGINSDTPYFISSGKPLLKYPENAFRIDFYAFCICTSGAIEVEIDACTHTLSKNGFIISAPSTFFKFRNASSDFKMKLLFFDKNYLLKNISNPFIIEKMNLFRDAPYSIIKSDLEAKHLLNLLFYLQEKTKQTGVFKDEIIRTIIFNILLEVAEILNKIRPIAPNSKPMKAELFLRFKKLVNDNILEQNSVDFYAKQLYVSNKYLIEIVKKTCGKTPHEIIDEALLKEAHILLSDVSLSITQIAYKLQFNSSSAFGRFFKKYTSISPSEYRKKENLV